MFVLLARSTVQITGKFTGGFFVGKERNFTGENFWARGYFVSMVGLDEVTVIEYIRNQEAEEERHDQMKLRMPL